MGLRKLQPMNEACLMKMGWSLMTGERSLWGDVLIGKYGRGDWNQGRIIVNPNDSSLWKAIAKSWPKIEFHRCWSIGDGCKVNVWTDKWIDGNTRLCDLEIHIPEESKQWMVKDIALPNGEWNFDMLQNLVPSSIIQKLLVIVPPSAQQGTDTQFWPGTSIGQFTVAAAYHLLAGPLITDSEKNWNRIWKIESIERIKVFIWQLTHDRLMTKARLASWQLGNSLCNQCLQFEENTLHVVRDCKVAVQVWRHLLSSQERGHFFMVEFHEWINFNLNNKFGMRFGGDWTAIWATTCFLLWQWRNKSLHDDEFVWPDKPWQVIINYVETYKVSIMVEDQLRLGRTQQEMNIAWIMPSPGWFALNTNGAAKAREKKAGCGGVLRNDKGSWIEGFTKALGDTTAYMAELWGIHEGLTLAYRRKVMKLELRTDSQVLAQSLKERKKGSVLGCALMKKIIKLLDGPWEVRIIHVYREANRCADMLASMGSEGSNEINYFEDPPARVMQIVEDDARGVSFPRLISL